MKFLSTHIHGNVFTYALIALSIVQSLLLLGSLEHASMAGAVNPTPNYMQINPNWYEDVQETQQMVRRFDKKAYQREVRAEEIRMQKADEAMEESPSCPIVRALMAELNCDVE